MRARATAPAIAWRSSCRTAPTSCCTFSRSTRSARPSCRSIRIITAPSWTTSSQHSEAAPGRRLRFPRALRSAAGAKARATRANAPSSTPRARRASRKGCLLSNFYFLNVGQRYVDEGGLCALRHGEERLITPLPLFHMNALAVSTTAMILTAGCVVQLDRFHPKTLVARRRRLARHHRPLSRRDAGDPAAAADRPNRSRRTGCASATAPMPTRKDHAAFEAALRLSADRSLGDDRNRRRRAHRRQPRAAPRRHALHRQAAFGDLRDLDVGRGTQASCWCANPAPDPRRGFFSGYLKDEAATAEAWRGGWFHTGDCVRRGRRRQPALRRPPEEHHPPRRRKHRRAGGRSGRSPAIRRSARSRSSPRPMSVRDEEVMACVVLAPNADADRDTALSIAGLVPRAPRLLQGARLRRLRRRAAGHLDATRCRRRIALAASFARAQSERRSNCSNFKTLR